MQENQLIGQGWLAQGVKCLHEGTHLRLIERKPAFFRAMAIKICAIFNIIYLIFLK